MSDEGDTIEPPTKKVKQDDDKDTDEEAPEEIKRNEAGDRYFDLSSKKRLTIRKWKGNTLLDIREYYEKNEKMLPGKKGISLTTSQYDSLRDLIKNGAIDKSIQDAEGKPDEK